MVQQNAIPRRGSNANGDDDSSEDSSDWERDWQED